jgi:L-alanine-DL-glutamate epimerase-like enolase superfamily enzyme
MRICKSIEDYEPYFVEDPTRDEQFRDDIPKLRKMTTVPLAAGEQWGQRWDFHKLVENKDIDYVRCTLPNVGGITEMLKSLPSAKHMRWESCRISPDRSPRRRSSMRLARSLAPSLSRSEKTPNQHRT